MTGLRFLSSKRRRAPRAPGAAVPGVLLLALVLVLPGCRSGQRAITDDGRLPVRAFVLLTSTKQVAFFRWAERTYEARHPDVDIIIEQFPGSSLKDFEIKLRLRFSSRQAPDAFLAEGIVIAEYARLGLLDPAPPYIVDMVQENSLNDMIRQAPYYDGVPYGIVSDAVWMALYYNKQMFREAGLDPGRPPQTWTELLDYADRLTVRRADGTPVRTGLSLRKTGYKPGTAGKWLSFLYSAGGRPFNEDGTEARFNSEAGREALRFYQTVLFEKNIDSVTLEGDQQGFGQGRVAMFMREIHVIRWMREHYPDVDFGVGPIPAREASISYGGPYLWVVSKDSPNREPTWRFIQFLMQDEAYTRYTSIGGITPTTRSVAALPQFSEDPMVQVFLDQEVAAPFTFPRAVRAMDTIGAYVERFCYGRIGIDEMLERAERDVNALLERNRKRQRATHADATF